MTTPSIQRWEYLTLESSTNYGTTKYYVNADMQPALKNKPLPEVINTIGAQGWEMVGIATTKDGLVYIFKRPSIKAPVKPAAAPQKPQAAPNSTPTPDKP